MRLFLGLFALLGSEYKSRDQVPCDVSKLDFTADKDEIDRAGKVTLYFLCLLNIVQTSKQIWLFKIGCY